MVQKNTSTYNSGECRRWYLKLQISRGFKRHIRSVNPSRNYIYARTYIYLLGFVRIGHFCCCSTLILDSCYCSPSLSLLLLRPARVVFRRASASCSAAEVPPSLSCLRPRMTQRGEYRRAIGERVPVCRRLMIQEMSRIGNRRRLLAELLKHSS